MLSIWETDGGREGRCGGMGKGREVRDGQQWGGEGAVTALLPSDKAVVGRHSAEDVPPTPPIPSATYSLPTSPSFFLASLTSHHRNRYIQMLSV
eukprot:12936620-Prorocentrum_lima.AAC.1